MPRAYSGDLRRRVVAAALEGGQSREVVARRFAVGRSSVYRWVETAQAEGRLEARPMRGGPRPMIRDETEAALKDMVKSDNHLTLAEYRDRLADRTEVRVHPWTVGRALRRLGLTRKKKTLRAIEQDEAAIWRNAKPGLKRSLGSLSSASSSSTRVLPAPTSSAATAGAPAASVPPARHLVVIGNASPSWARSGPEGIVAAMSIPAATDGAVFCAWLEQVLLPELRRIRPDAVLVMDNLAAHKTQAVRALLDGSGFAYRYLPRYSPDLNPIGPPGPR